MRSCECSSGEFESFFAIKSKTHMGTQKNVGRYTNEHITLIFRMILDFKRWIYKTMKLNMVIDELHKRQTTKSISRVIGS